MSDSVASALAGAGGGIASMALTYPLITLSTRSQVSKTERMTQLATAKKIISEEGVAGLYSYFLFINFIVECPLHCLVLLLLMQFTITGMSM